MKRIIITGVVLGLLIAGMSVSFAIKNEGAERIIINGGRMGNIDFPHHQHQNVLQDCKTCHILFPQKEGSIDRLKAEKLLKKMQVMANCRGCHRDRKEKGLKAGPTSCTKCHNKELKLERSGMEKKAGFH